MDENNSIWNVSPLSQSFVEGADNGNFLNGLNIENQQEMPNNQPEAFDNIGDYLEYMKEKNDEQGGEINIDDFLQGFQKDVIYGALNVEDEELYQLEQKSLKDFFAERSWNRKDIVSKLSESNLDLRIKIKLYLLITDMKERKLTDIYKLMSASDFNKNNDYLNNLKLRSIIYEFQDFFRLLPDNERTFKNMLLIPNIFSMDMSYIVEDENISMNEKLESEIQKYDEFICDLVQSFLRNKHAVTNSDYKGYQIIKDMYKIYLNYLSQNEWIDIEDENGNKISRECATHRLKKQGMDIDKTICNFVDLLNNHELISDEQKTKLKSCFSGWNIKNWFSVYLSAVWKCVKCWGKNLFRKSNEKINYFLDDEIQLRKFEKFNAIFSPNYLCRLSNVSFGYELYQNLYSENRAQGFVLNDMLYEQTIKTAKESSWENIKDVEAELKNKAEENNINVVAEDKNKEDDKQSLEDHDLNLNEGNAENDHINMESKLKKFVEEKGKKDKNKHIENNINQQIEADKKINPEEQSKINNNLVENDPVEQAWDLIHGFYFVPDAVFTERETKIIQHWLAGAGRMHWNNGGLNDHPSGKFQEHKSKSGEKLYEKTAEENKNILGFIEESSQNPGELVARSKLIIAAMANPDKQLNNLPEDNLQEQAKELEKRMCECVEIQAICKLIQNKAEKPKPQMEGKGQEQENIGEI